MSWIKLGKLTAILYVLLLSLFIVVEIILYFLPVSIPIIEWIMFIIFIFLLVSPLFCLLFMPFILKYSATSSVQKKQSLVLGIMSYIALGEIGLPLLQLIFGDFPKVDCQTTSLPTVSIIYKIGDLFYAIKVGKFAHVLIFSGVIFILTIIYIFSFLRLLLEFHHCIY